MSKSYIYLKQSSDPAGVGDLTNKGIVKDVYEENERFSPIKNTIITDQGDWRPEEIVTLTPMLIMDDPEIFSDQNKYWKDQTREDQGFFIDELWESDVKKYGIKHGIPFHSNESVYEYLKSKGIKPADETLIEFDGEIELKYFCEKYQAFNKCDYSQCKCGKVAIIKDTEVKQESEEQLFQELLSIADKYSESQRIIKIMEHFKIERRK